MPSPVFAFPSEPHLRRHGPRGYADSAYYKPWLRDEFAFRCAYCLTRERRSSEGADGFTVDHFIPRSAASESSGEYDNLVYACSRCNSYKREVRGVLDPTAAAYALHLTFDEEGYLHAHTRQGRGHVELLDLNAPELVEFRRRLLRTLGVLVKAGDEETVAGWLGFPEELPNLRVLRPPGGNSRHDGVDLCFFERRRAGLLPRIY